MKTVIHCKSCKHINNIEDSKILEGSYCEQCQSELHRYIEIIIKVQNKTLGTESIGRLVDVKKNDVLRDGVLRISQEELEVGAYNDYYDFFSYKKIPRNEITRILFEKGAITSESQLAGPIMGGVGLSVGYGIITYLKNPNGFQIDKFLPVFLTLLVVVPILMVMFSSKTPPTALFIFESDGKVLLDFGVPDERIEKVSNMLKILKLPIDQVGNPTTTSSESIKSTEPDQTSQKNSADQKNIGTKVTQKSIEDYAINIILVIICGFVIYKMLFHK